MATFGIYAKPYFLLTLALGLAVVFMVFATFPSFDIAISRLFYNAGTCGDEALCGSFPAAESTGFANLRNLLYVMPYAVLTAAIANSFAISKQQKLSIWRDAKVAYAIIASFVIGPGLIVNGVLKEVVLRSRPRDVLVFGGDSPFVPVGQLAGSCASNCSFVSGEAAIAPIMVLSILLFPKQWQKPAMLILLPCSLAMALLRVAFGAHYMSDAILGYGITLLTFSVIAQVILRFSKV